MVSVVIINNHEPNVVQMTFENLYSELKDISGSELLIKSDWLDLSELKNRYVCFVEADCLLSPGYFQTQLKDLQKKGSSRQVGVVTSATAINRWENKIYGYSSNKDSVMPIRSKKSQITYPVQIAYIPGAIVRVSMLQTVLKKLKPSTANLVNMSSEISMAFWDKGYRVHLNPQATYVTTEGYVNDIAKLITTSDETKEVFKRWSI